MNLENSLFRWTGTEWAGYYVTDDVGILSVRAFTKEVLLTSCLIAGLRRLSFVIIEAAHFPNFSHTIVQSDDQPDIQSTTTTMARVNRTETRCDHYKVLGFLGREDGSIIFNKETPVKDVEYSTTICPECYDDVNDAYVAAWKDDHGDEICPECGMVCGGKRTPGDPTKLVYGRSLNDSVEEKPTQPHPAVAPIQ